MPHITVGPSRVFYRTAGNRHPQDEPTLVFLHGSGGDGSVWDEQLDGLKGDARVLIPDLPGHGYSDGPLLESAKSYALWVDTFLHALAVEEFFLAGHSLGGAIAQEFISAFPDKVMGLILAGCGPDFTIPPYYLDTVRRDFLTAINASCQMAFAPGNAHRFFERGFQLLYQNGQEPLYNDLLACSAFDSRPWLSSVRMPTLIICGTEDKITPPSAAQELLRLIPGAIMRLMAGAGHMVMLEAAEEFNETVRAFITCGLLSVKTDRLMAEN